MTLYYCVSLFQIYLSKKVNPRGKILIPCQLNKPNPKCYVCSEKREVSVKVRLDKMTVKIFEDKILKGDLAMVAPDVEIETRGIILISSGNNDILSRLGASQLMLYQI